MRNRNPGRDFDKTRRPAPPPDRGKSRGKPEKKPAPAPAERVERPQAGALWLYGLHAVQAALANPLRKLGRAVLTPRAIETLGSRLLNRVQVQSSDPAGIDRLLPPGAVHQGAALEAWPLKSRDLAEILAEPSTEKRRLVLVLDQLSDPHNVGAILRTAAAFQVSAVIVQDRHAPPQSGALAKAASGALDIIPYIEVVNIARALDDLAKHGFWRIALAGDGEASLAEAAPIGDVALVLGSEGGGIRRLVREHCETSAFIPLSAKMESLNVSNAAAIALYELRR
ncbi:MAG TPA: RNA methyltransferase [Verrucomicrobiae bacterium]|jgi:23S rRNA (guanosine2251-2'-O)-methyltransferase|nr:RNA methyltransferase [Verrucomicrobiae bacterium]